MEAGELRTGGTKGAHTTTNRQMVRLPTGALLIDTPGMRELGLVGDGDGLAQSFPDIADLAASCRFRDCRHESEPGCAVRDAMRQGALDPKRLKSYNSIGKEMERERNLASYRLGHIRKGRRPEYTTSDKEEE